MTVELVVARSAKVYHRAVLLTDLPGCAAEDMMRFTPCPRATDPALAVLRHVLKKEGRRLR